MDGANDLELGKRYRIETSFNPGGRNTKKEGDYAHVVGVVMQQDFCITNNI